MSSAANSDVVPCRQVCAVCKHLTAGIVVGAFGDLAGAHRKQRLTAIKCLYLGLFIDAQHDGVCGRGHIEADNISGCASSRAPGTARCALSTKSGSVDSLKVPSRWG